MEKRRLFEDSNECDHEGSDKENCNISPRDLSFIKIDDRTFECLACNVQNKIGEKQKDGPITRHMKSSSHVRNYIVYNERKANKPIPQDFHERFLLWMVSNNIPLSKITKPEFTQFIEEEMRVNLKSRTYYSETVIENLFKQIYNETLEYFKGKEIFVQLDSTTDKRKISTYNIIVGTVDRDKKVRCFLADTFQPDTGDHQV